MSLKQLIKLYFDTRSPFHKSREAPDYFEINGYLLRGDYEKFIKPPRGNLFLSTNWTSLIFLLQTVAYLIFFYKVLGSYFDKIQSEWEIKPINPICIGLTFMLAWVITGLIDFLFYYFRKIKLDNKEMNKPKE